MSVRHKLPSATRTLIKLEQITLEKAYQRPRTG